MSAAVEPLTSGNVVATPDSQSFHILNDKHPSPCIKCFHGLKYLRCFFFFFHWVLLNTFLLAQGIV